VVQRHRVAPTRRGRPKRSETEAEAARARILKAARRLFVKGGYETASMRSIAKAAGCSSGALYTIFPSKRAILRAIGEDAFADLDLALESATRGKHNPVTHLKLLGITYVEFWRRRPDDFRHLFLIEDKVVDVDERYFVDSSRSLAQVVGRFVDPAQKAIAARLLMRTSVAGMIELIFCALHGVCCALIAMPEHRWHEPDMMGAEMMDGLIHGFARP